MKIKRPKTKFKFDPKVEVKFKVRKSALNRLDKARKGLSRNNMFLQLIDWVNPEDTP